MSKRMMFLMLAIVILIKADTFAQMQKYAVEYRCPPCGCPQDDHIFEKAGYCPSCNMALTASVKGLEGKPNTAFNRYSVAVLIFDMADIMDVTGPMSVFEHAGFSVYTVAKDKQPKQIGMFMELVPDYTFDNLPDVEVLVIPGGGPAESNQDKAIVDWIKEKDQEIETLFSVCSGAFFLGQAGLLDHREATTFASLIPVLKQQFPKARVMDDVKYTNNGHVITSSGLSSGIDASFEVVAKYYGYGRAQDIANHMEYPWQKSDDYARVQLADNYLLFLQSLIRPFSVEYDYSNGDQSKWEQHYKLWDGVDDQSFMVFLHSELNRFDGVMNLVMEDAHLKFVYNHPALGQGSVQIQLDKSSNAKYVYLIAHRL